MKNGGRQLFQAALLLFSLTLIGQTHRLTGTITAEEQPVSFASVVCGTRATSANDRGQFELRLSPGEHTVVIHQLGYKKSSVVVNMTADRALAIELHPESYLLGEVEVKAGEDPAYPIIRNAIARREKYRKQADTYSCRSYIKGVYRVDKLPKSAGAILKTTGDDPSDTNKIKGIIYLSESENLFYFQRPNRKEVMISSKVSGRNNAFSFNQLAHLRPDFYTPLITLGEFGTRPFVSPIAENAFTYYKFILLGTAENVHKIKVIPRREYDPAFSGTIYIADNTWRITGTALTLKKAAGLNFVDSMRIAQIHAPVSGDSLWMPVQIDLGFGFKFLGFEGSGYYHAGMSEYNMQPQFSDKFFSNEVFKIEPEAGKKDSLYWEKTRSIPLTAEETRDYARKDSIERLEKTPRYSDSTDRVHNKFNLSHLISGYTFTRTRKKYAVTLPGLLTGGIQYNTVEGWNVSNQVKLELWSDNRKRYELTAEGRYGFGNQLAGGEFTLYRYYNPLRQSGFGIKVRSMVEQFNRNAPIAPFINSYYTLWHNENHMKLYRETGGEVAWHSEISNGINFAGTARYGVREPLHNTTFRAARDIPDKYFTPNHPSEYDITHPFSTNRALTLNARVRFVFKQRYASLPGQKIAYGSRYPRFTLHYRRAIPAADATADFEEAAAEISDAVNLRLWGRLHYSFKGGLFTRTREMYLMDHAHFTGNQTALLMTDPLRTFRMLPYYSFSSGAHYFEAHMMHDFRGKFFSRLPGLREAQVTEVIGAHFLMNEKLPQYFEVTIGANRIFRILTAEFVTSFEPSLKPRFGFVIGTNVRF